MELSVCPTRHCFECATVPVIGGDVAGLYVLHFCIHILVTNELQIADMTYLSNST